MKHISTLLASLIIVLLFSGCPQSAIEELGYGTYEDGTYSNAYLGIQLDLPTNWSYSSIETNKELVEAGQDILAGSNKELKQQMKASEKRTVNLFSCFKHPVGSAVDFNPSILAVAENVRFIPGIKIGQDYHFHSKKVLEQSPINFEFLKPVYAETHGNIEFHVLETKISNGIVAVQQKYYATKEQDYILVFVVSFTHDDEERELTDILATVQRTS